MRGAPQDYDDSYCIHYARAHGGCVMSNDLYRDHVQAVAKRLLPLAHRRVDRAHVGVQHVRLGAAVRGVDVDRVRVAPHHEVREAQVVEESDVARGDGGEEGALVVDVDRLEHAHGLETLEGVSSGPRRGDDYGSFVGN